jgi:serpin B
MIFLSGVITMKDNYAIATTNLTLLLVLSGLISQYQTEAFNLKLTPQLSSLMSLTMAMPKQDHHDLALIQTHNQFTFSLFSRLAQQDPDQNLFVSPASVAIALSMLYNGANGTTQQEMAQVLGYQGISLKEINLANQNLQKSLQTTDNKVELVVANSLWAKKAVSFRHQFLKNNQTFYNAQVTSLDFASPQAVNIINRWVKENTRGKIDGIINNIDPDDVMFVINAIYFKGIWQTEFAPQLTESQPFYLANGKTKNHPLMARYGEYQYYENQLFQGVSIPYGEGRISLYIFLPKQDKNLNSFINNLTLANWEQWLGEFRQREGTLKIPKFKLEYEVTLNSALQALGMKSMFNNGADFSQLTSVDVKVNEVKHKTFVEINEEGTEAAAVTSIGIRATSATPEQQPFNMVVNRPFFCAIRDNQTGTILFMGSIFEPK